MANARKAILLFILSNMLMLTACSESVTPDTSESDNSADNTSAQITELRSQLAEMQASAMRIKDSNDIKRLQRAYGYYMDEGLWDEIADLFAANGTLEIARDGVYQGQARVREYLYRLGNGQSGLAEGQLNEHYQLMPVVTLGDDGLSAKGRWRAIIMDGQFGESANWGEGPYENEYVKEEGVWKISKLHWFQTIMVPYDGGWAEHADINGGIYVSDTLPSDAPSTTSFGSWPETFLPPFHFENPVATYVDPESVEEGQ